MRRPQPIVLPSFDAASRRERIFARAPGAGVSARAVGAVTEIEVIGEIGFDVTVSAFREKLRGAGDVLLTINSPGGIATDGVAIFNSATSHAGHVRVEIIGIAASAASIIAMAGDEVAIASNAHLMIHRSWGLTIGNSVDHRESVELLERIDRSMAETYARRTGGDVGEILSLMDSTTWFTGEEAVEAGFADATIEDAAVSAQFDLSVYGNAPAALRRSTNAPMRVESRSELERLLHSAGLSREASKRVAAGGYPALSKSGVDEIERFAERVAAFNSQLAERRM